MRRLNLHCDASDVEGLLALEGRILPESQELRNRVLERAMSSLQHHTAVPLEMLAPKPRRLSLGLAAAAIVMLTALCAVAFVAGYRTRSGGALGVPTAEGLVTPASAPQHLAAPSVVVALIPVPTSLGSNAANSEPVMRNPRGASMKPTESAASGTSSEAFARELQVLQPARQAVARHEFSSALTIVAEHQHLYPAGVLTEEREALRIKSLVGLGRVTEAERAGAAFRKRFPRSALVGRIDEMLGTKQ